MDLKIKHFVVFITIALLISCKEAPGQLAAIDGKLLAIDSLTVADSTIASYIRPFHDRINTILDSTLAYAPKTLTKDDGVYNTSAGNLLADIILEQANPIFRSRKGRDIDFALMNHGGIRAIISKGNVSARTAYEVMPFENGISVVELSGESVAELASFLIKSGRAHPISGIQIIVDKNDGLQAINIQGKPFDRQKTYFVATSSYLVSGGDDMEFFKNGNSITDTDYFIRTAMIDYFSRKDTITAQVDDRFIKL